MQLTEEQVMAPAPDASAAKAGKGLAAARHWQGLGQSPAAVWGLCQGSALYQVQVELASLTTRCTCPSRKIPCKHRLGLLLLAAGAPAALPEAEPPEWVAEWLKKRTTASEQRQARVAEKAASVDPAAQAKRAERRLAQVAAGVETFDLWLDDLARNGLAGLELQPSSFWEGQAARLVDAQAAGLAGRVRRIAAIPGSGSDWPERLLDQLGQLALLTHAFHRLDRLDPPLREDVRQAIGWTLTQEEVAAHGDVVTDDWLVLGQWVDATDERVRTQRTWLLCARSGRHALELKFSPMNPPFPEPIVPGIHQEADLAFWPSAYPLRARIAARHGAPAPLQGGLPSASTLDAALAGVARALARQPWLDRFLFILAGVTPVRDEEGQWRAQDSTGAALPLTRGEHWPLLIFTGGAPCDLAAEWDGEELRPLGLMVGDDYYPLEGKS
jgi:hypothetical protein